MTQRLAEQSGRELRSWPLRYGNSTSLLRGSRVINSCARWGSMVKPIPRTYEPMNETPTFLASCSGLPVTREARSSDDAIRLTIMSSATRIADGLRGALLVQTAAYSRTALFDGHGLLFTDWRISVPDETT